jgi:general stress protein 26
MLQRALLSSVSLGAGVWLGVNHGDKFSFIGAGIDRALKPESSASIDTPDGFIKVAMKTSDKSKFAVLSTINSVTKGISSRTIQPFPAEIDEKTGGPVLYFNTNKFTRKVKDLNSNSVVSLVYLREDDMSCVSYMGTCERVPYPESTKHWEDWLYMFYPMGPNELEGSPFTTWRIRPTSITLLSLKDNISSSRSDIRPPEIALDLETSRWVIACSGKEDGTGAPA